MSSELEQRIKHLVPSSGPVETVGSKATVLYSGYSNGTTVTLTDTIKNYDVVDVVYEHSAPDYALKSFRTVVDKSNPMMIFIDFTYMDNYTQSSLSTSLVNGVSRLNFEGVIATIKDSVLSLDTKDATWGTHYAFWLGGVYNSSAQVFRVPNDGNHYVLDTKNSFTIRYVIGYQNIF